MFLKICPEFSFSNLWMLIHFLDGAFSISRSFKFLWSLHFLFCLFMVCAFCALSRKSLTPRLQRYSLCFLYLVSFSYKRLCILSTQVSSSMDILKTKDLSDCCKHSWRRAWQPTLVFLIGESPMTEESGSLQSLGSKRIRHNWAAKHTQHSCQY